MTKERKGKSIRSRGYEVGKGRPPKEHQFKAGQPSANPRGRPKGSKNRTDFEKLMAEKVTVGYDSRGRPIKRTMAEVVDRTLLNLAVKEKDLRAIKVIKEAQLKFAQLHAAHLPDEAAVRADIEQEEQRRELVVRLTQMLEFVADAKRLGILETHHDGGIRVAPWVIQAAQDRCCAGGDEVTTD